MSEIQYLSIDEETTDSNLENNEENVKVITNYI